MQPGDRLVGVDGVNTTSGKVLLRQLRRAASSSNTGGNTASGMKLHFESDQLPPEVRGGAVQGRLQGRELDVSTSGSV